MAVFNQLTPVELRKLIKTDQFKKPTSGFCPGYVQTNLVILPQNLAADFARFTRLNPKPCPVLEITQPGSQQLLKLAKDVNIATDFPQYRIYRQGKLVAEPFSITDVWQPDFVSFLIGCSFSFEAELSKAGIELRHITEGVNVPMFNTNLPLKSVGPFHGNLVVSMRPIPVAQVDTAIKVTAAMPRVHGAPVQIGHPEQIGIANIDHPDYGDAVTIKPGEVPVFWACGVTPQNVLMQSKPALAITHAPGHMLVTDVLNTELKGSI